MKRSKLVKAKTYFNYPMSVNHKKGLVTIQDKANYIISLSEHLLKKNMFGLNAIALNDSFSEASTFLRQCISYEHFMMILSIQQDRKLLENVIVASLFTTTGRKWISRMAVENRKSLDMYANDPDFSKLIDYIEKKRLWNDIVFLT